MEDKPRYSRISDLMHLIFLMASKIQGVTIADIQQEFQVSRRTAMRMRDAVMNILPQVDEIETNNRQKSWGFIDYCINPLVSFTSEEIATLEKIKNDYDEITSKDLKNIVNKLKTLVSKKNHDILDNLELLLQTEGIAVKQRPNYKINLSYLSAIREAIKNKVKIQALYNDKLKTLSPLGLIYGERVYLVAIEEEKGSTPYNYKFHLLKNIELISEKQADYDFDLKSFSEQSFGVFQGEIYNIKLEFSKDVAEEVKNYNFHPTQKIKQNENGSVIVSFKASGDKHIIWHLFKWGNNVKILSPTTLKAKYKEYLTSIIEEL